MVVSTYHPSWWGQSCAPRTCGRTCCKGYPISIVWVSFLELVPFLGKLRRDTKQDTGNLSMFLDTPMRLATFLPINEHVPKGVMCPRVSSFGRIKVPTTRSHSLQPCQKPAVAQVCGFFQGIDPSLNEWHTPWETGWFLKGTISEENGDSNL